MADFERLLLNTLNSHNDEVHAWCVLPNHYHLLAKVVSLRKTVHALGRLHGRASFEWNRQDQAQGRKCWFRCADRSMRSERHILATINYIHHNPVHHGYVKEWQDWPFSSVAQSLDMLGREETIRRWKAFPILDYGKGWDDASL